MPPNPTHIRTVVTRRTLHRPLVVFASACLVGTLASDIAYWRTSDILWVDFSDWLVTAGVIVGIVALVVALIEIFALRRPARGETTWPLAVGGLLALAIAILDMMIHTRDAWTSVVPWGLAASAAAVFVLLATAIVERGIERPVLTDEFTDEATI
jgi:uncharacterized membrane protein